MSFYLYSLYALFVIDDRKKDFNVMLAHHTIAFVLLLITFTAK